MPHVPSSKSCVENKFTQGGVQKSTSKRDTNKYF